MSSSPNTLTANEAAGRIAAGELQSELLVRACLDRIAYREPTVRAWAHIDTDAALAAAREADKQRQSNSHPLGALHGIPIGIKDIINAAGLRTEHNSEIFRGHHTHTDAAVVMMLRNAGAIILGKTETVEFGAWGGRVALTRNPHDLTRTPGGSSSGSAAAVADFMVPLTLGTQTGGSIVRPASYCGVVGFKPTYGTVSTEGMKRYANTLDTLGWYARSVDDIALLARVFEVVDDRGLATPSPQTLRIEVFHQISRCDFPAASVCSIDITGVAPTPALRRTTGFWLGRRVKLPRGALTSNTSPSCVRLHRNELPIPFNSLLTLMRK